MLAELYLPSVTRFLSVVTRGSRQERTALSLLATGEQQMFALSLDAVAHAAYGELETLKANATLSAIVRLIWNLTPLELFTQPSPNFRALAKRSVREKLGLSGDEDRLVSDLVIVFKRIRSFHRLGRVTSSFRIGYGPHEELLSSQDWRCAVCMYRFDDDLDKYAAEEGDVLIDTKEPAIGEVTLPVTYRRPELDHIIPHLLGGDDRDNWQVLCRCCNAGKSDAITSVSKQFNMPSMRAADLHEFTASKRFSVIANARKKMSEFTLGPDQHLRVFRIQELGMLNVENLTSRVA